ncbi:PREDICTED: probable LRR receptor-like serine/threonine-protein kinase At3g47570 [Theobroma cacao]|uniref:non-specific serine/threonine protein kinase n=2 Tax=Theobroma cacao TaxID=3641 RepID=A0AB32WEA5_THECC|nr:PREDICTED: probable LRR receptor-like serine/threonine-protein kinase At3g47570 [Theobroma cacao]
MKLTCLFFQGILLLWMSSCSESAMIPAFANESDRLALLDFKNRVTQDPLHVMDSWNNSVHFCSWVGVTCSPSNGRVVILNLKGQKLVGSIPPSIGNLTFLTRINLVNNNFRGEIPQEIGRLLRLQHLNLSYNSFGGQIPTNLTQCTELAIIHIGFNGLIGQIPDQLASLSKLEFLVLQVNNLTGTIPAWIGNFSSLHALSLAQNNLQGTIPDELGQLSGLGGFHLYGNYLSGIIPPSIYNISSIYYFSVTQNQLQGHLPPDVGLTLPNLEIFAGGVNNFTGTIPVSLSNASRLQIIDFAENGLTGTIPGNLGNLEDLIRLNFDDNKLGTGKIGDLSFFGSLTNISALEVLGLSGNRFGGELPSSIANLSDKLKIFTIGRNLIHGSIPVGIGNLVNLNSLGMEGNQLEGTLPDVLGKLQNLEGLQLNYNRFSGSMPFSLGNLTALTRLFMDENRFEGSIPPSLGNCQNLLELNFSSNNLSGTIPREILALSSLSISLSMSHNSLSGSIPVEVGNLNILAELDLAENRLSGEIPSSLASCISLERLYLEGNAFEGTIPLSLKSLRGLEEIDLSRNNLSGQIPEFLSKILFLKHLNLSHNDFDGEVSQAGIFGNASAFSVVGNNKLCGGVQDLHLPTCTRKSPGRRLAPKVVIPVTGAVIFVVLLLCSYASYHRVRNSGNQSNASFSKEWQLCMSYSDIVKATDGFSEENLIGSGSFGSVYKGTISRDETVVAIKVLNLQQQGASRSFIDECNALRSVRHRNLLKIITACSTVDHQGNDFKALVFEFMPNGNLDQWLHPGGNDQYQSMRLSLIQRLNIAIDIASALDYLHHHCVTPIVHCDLKPSNVLLDENITAHVGDFGLARFIFDSSSNASRSQTMSVRLKGSMGYIPPEYGMGGQVSIHGDTYSYGILLLEMLTGKRPTDDSFEDDLGICEFVDRALPGHVMDIVDRSMLFEEENVHKKVRGNREDYVEERALIKNQDSHVSSIRRREECLVSMMKIGLSCAATLPSERMTMTVVVNNLLDIKAALVEISGF